MKYFSGHKIHGRRLDAVNDGKHSRHALFKKEVRCFKMLNCSWYYLLQPVHWFEKVFFIMNKELLANVGCIS